MARNDLHIEPKRDDAGVAPGMLVHLSELSDSYMIAEGEPDIRGWEVRLSDGRHVGKVDDLVIDSNDLSVDYIEVRIDKDFLQSDEDRWALVPVESARADGSDTIVIVDRLPATGLSDVPGALRGRAAAELERSARARTGGREAGSREERRVAERRFWGDRRLGREDSPYIRRAGRQRGREAGAGSSDAAPGDVLVDEVVVAEVVVDSPAMRADRAEGSSGPRGPHVARGESPAGERDREAR